MAQRLTLMAVLVLLVTCPAWADFSEEFTDSAVLGSGTGGSYVAGANWTIDHGLAKVEPSGGTYGAAGTCRLGYAGGVGPNDGTPYRILRNSATGGGTYFTRSQKRLVMIVAWQDANNYYRIETAYMYRDPIGNCALSIAKVANGTTTWLAGATPGTMQEGGETDNYEVTVNWDPSANTISASLVIKNSGGTTLDSCSTNPVSGNSAWTTGKFGCCNDNSLIETDRLSFTTTNAAPTVDAGSNQTITLPAQANLSGTASDDGLPNPPGAMTYTWTKSSGPGTVTFGNANALSTTAGFSVDGTYVLNLAAYDGAATTNDTVTITVNPAAANVSEDFTNASVIGTGTAANYVSGTDWAIDHGSAQVDTSTGAFGAAGTLRLGYTGTPRVGPDNGVPNRIMYKTAVGGGTYTSRSFMRPVLIVGYQDANNYYRVEAAYMYRDPIGNCTLAIGKVVNGTVTWLAGATPGSIQDGVDTDHFEISVVWNAASNQISASLAIKNSSDVLRDSCSTSTVSGQAGWTSGKFGFVNDYSLIEVDKLTFTASGGANQAPTANAGNDQTIVQPNAATLNGSASDDGQPNPPGTLAYTWTKVSGPGNVSFGNANALSTTATFDATGTYVLNLHVSDSVLSADDTVQITVNAASSSDFLEDFTTASVIGTGLGSSYVPGTNWTISHGCAQLDTTWSMAGGTGACRLGYSGTPRIGPDNGTPFTLLYNTALGKGTYTFRGDYRIVCVFGYQDDNNYYTVQTYSTLYSGIGQANLAVGKVVNGTTTWLGGATLSTLADGGSSDCYTVTVEWDPAAHQVRASLTIVDSSNNYRDSCTTPVLSDILSGSDPVWTTGKLGNRVTGLLQIDKIGFTNAVANLDEHFTSSAIGSGTGGGYTAGANWSVAHGLAVQNTSGTFGTGAGTVQLGQAGGVGPNNGTPNTLLSVNNCAGGQYIFRGAANADFVFGYADDNNYYIAQIKSASRTVGGVAATKSFAIGKVVSGTTTWLGHAGTFDTSDTNVIYEAEVIWDTTANKISGIVKRFTYSGGVETLTAIESIDPVDDGNLRESGKFGVREATSTVRLIDRLAYSSTFNSSPTAGLFDIYGGHKGIKGTKTGYFHLQQIGNRWMWITPEGNGFIPLGVALMARQSAYYGRDRDNQLNLKSHADFCNLKFNNSFGAWQTATLNRFREWGLNYTGYYTGEDLRAKNIPAVKTLGLITGGMGGADSVCGNIWYDLGFDFMLPDAYAPGVQGFANSRIRSADPDAKDPMILALYADEPDNMKGFWPSHPHMGLALLLGKTQIGAAASSSGYSGPMFTNYAKQTFVSYLTGKYGTIGALNTAWGMSFANWAALDNLTYSSATYGNWNTLLGRTNDPNGTVYPAYKQDLDHGIEMFATQWATVIKTAKDGWDTNHAIGQHLYDVSVRPQVAAGFSSVGAFDFYMFDGGASDFTALGKPFMKVFYSSAEPDSPLAFDGTVDTYSKVNVSGTDFLRVHVDGADYWFGNGGTFNYWLFGHIRGMSLPGKNNPGDMRMRWCGNETGGGWFECHPTDPPSTGTVDEWIAALNAMAPAKATFDRRAYYGVDASPTQEDRGSQWASYIDSLVNDQTTGGVKFRLGGEIWSWVDTGWDYSLEQRNFGLVTMKDNAYDGVEATTLGADGTGGTWDDQLADYGDFLTSIKTANMAVYGRILGLGSGGTAPSITTQPQSQTKNVGESVTFTVAASGDAPISYQWKKNGSDISGATSASYNIPSVTTGDAGSYTCYVSNPYGNVTSNAATLTVNSVPPPTITQQPQSQTIILMAPVTFSVTATGEGTLTYQWKKGGSNISGATGTSYTINNVATADAGDYTCAVTNGGGTTTSNAATLTVTNDAAVNGGFETVSGTPSMPTSWTFTSSNSCWSSNTNATYLRTGSRSLGCTNASGSSSVPVANDAAVTLIPGTYTISCYIKSNGAFGGGSKGFRLELLNSSDTVVANSSTQKGTFSSWTLVTVNYTVTSTGTFHIRLDMIGKPSGTLYIDDVKLSQ